MARSRPTSRSHLLRGLALATVALTALALAPAASAAVVNLASGVRAGVQPLAASDSSSSDGTLLEDPLDGTSQGVTYHGGPVLHAVTTYAIFWDPAGSFTPTTRSLVGGFLANVAHDSGADTNVFSVAGQYSDSSGSGSYEESYGGSFVDADPYPGAGECSTSAPGAPTCLYDSQIVSELASFVGTHHLPSGMSAMYVVLTPDTVVTCIDGSSDCSTNSYCSLHSYAGSGGSTLLYIEIPFTLLGSSGDAKACQDDGNSAVQAPNGDPAFGDVALKSLSHEMLETISDPLLDAWYDADGNEIADLCNGLSWNPDSFLPTEGGDAAAGTLFNQTIDGAHYYLQGSWSNRTNDCALTGAPTPSFSAPAGAVAGTAVSFAGSPGTNSPVSSYQWSFGDGASAAGQSVSHAFGAAGTYTVTLTVTDGYGNSGSVSEQVSVASAGKTAAASGSNARRHATTRCGKAHRRHGVEVRHCTRTVTSRASVKTCTHRHGHAKVCRSVVRTLTRRSRCRESRKRGASTWSRRCGQAVTVHRSKR